MISDNVDSIRGRIQQACQRAGRDPGGVTLIAVTKTFSPETVQEAVEAGVTDLGENYVQELLAKRAHLSALPVRWHFIGHLQRNKVRQLAGWIECIHAVDSLSLARELDRHAAAAGRSLQVLVEVNTTGEPSKFGVAPEETLPFIRSLGPLGSLRVAGLMTIGPFLPDPEGSRPMFRRLRELRDAAMTAARTEGLSTVTMEHLSMGMTGDFEVAIEEGATLIRVGRAIFGPRRKAG